MKEDDKTTFVTIVIGLSLITITALVLNPNSPYYQIVKFFGDIGYLVIVGSTIVILVKFVRSRHDAQ